MRREDTPDTCDKRERIKETGRIWKKRIGKGGLEEEDWKKRKMGGGRGSK